MKIQKRNNNLLCIVLLSLSLLIGCASGESGGDRTTITIQSTPYPEIANITSNVSAYFEIAGKICQLNVDQDTTLSGQCPDISLGSHSYILKYRLIDTGAILATTEGSVTIEQGKNTEISFPPLVRYPFELVANYNTSAGPVDLTIGDLNNDGIPDVVTANKDSDSISVLLGNSDESLDAADVYQTGPGSVERLYPEHIELGDLNGDGNLDVAVMHSGSENGYSGDVTLFFGNGDGTFQEGDVYFQGGRPVSMALGDLNRDGFDDMVVANSGVGEVRILFGSGDGFLMLADSYLQGFVSDVILGDLNGDGNLDMVAYYSPEITVFMGNGDGTFQTGPTTTVGILSSLVVGDVNGDIHPDLISLIPDSPNVEVFSGNGDGTFQAETLYAAGSSPKSLALGDINGDGYPDIVTDDPEAKAIVVLSGNGDGLFNPARFYEIDNSPVSVAIGDLNGDSGLEIFATIYDSDLVALLLSR